MLSRRGMLGLAAAIPLLSHGAAAAGRMLRVGYQNSGSLLILTQQRRLEMALGGAGVGVQWLEFQSGPPLLEALNAASIDVGAVGDTPPIFAQASGVDFVYIGVQRGTGRNIAILAPPGSSLRGLADLKGKRIAFTKGSAAHYLTVRALATVGLGLADVQPAYLQPADAGAAFRNGSVDAWTIWDPFYALTEREPGVRVLTTGEISPFNSFVLARREYAQATADIALALRGEINAAAGWAEAHPDELGRILSEVTGVSLDAQRVAAARGTYRVALLDAEVTARQQEEADTFFALHVIPRKIDVRAAVWTPPAETASAGAKP
jgi:aliphatic sulfonates family ABC transporter substrate-binding protein